MPWWRKKEKRKGFTVICGLDYPECRKRMQEMRIRGNDAILLSKTSSHHWTERLSGRTVSGYSGISKELLLNYGCSVLPDAVEFET
jgi:hypothetical protein